MATEDTTTVTQEDVYEALEEVIDPELGLDFVSLGLVYEVEIEDSDVYVTFTLTYPGCPIGPQVSEQIKEFVGELEGVDGVHPKMVFDPPWTPDKMSEDAKFALGYVVPANRDCFRGRAMDAEVPARDGCGSWNRRSSAAGAGGPRAGP